MALVATEGFGFSTAIADYVTYGVFSIINGPGSIAIFTNGPLGDNYILIAANGSFPGIQRQVLFGSSTVFVGSRINASNAPWAVSLVDANAAMTLTVVSNALGGATVYRGSYSGTSIGTITAGSFPMTGWFYFELGATIASGTGGSVTVRCNGVVVGTISGVNTENGTSTSIAAVNFYGVLSGNPVYFAHQYFCDNTGSAPWNTFLGDVRVQSLFPTSNDSVQFTPTQSVVTANGPLSTTGYGVNANTVYFSKVVAASSGVLEQADMTPNSSYTGHWVMGLYADNGSGTAPSGAALATSAVVMALTAGVTQPFIFTSGPTLTAGTTYWIAVQGDTPVQWLNLASAVANTWTSMSSVYAAGVLPTPASLAGLSTPPVYMDMAVIKTSGNNAAVVATLPAAPLIDFNQSSTVGAQDTFNYAAMSSSLGTIYGVIAKALVSKSDAGARSVEMVVKSATATATGSSIAIGTSPRQVTSIFTVDPNTSAAWTQSAVNAATMGYKISA